jgi:alpha-1,3-mannosyltransferase
LSTHGAIFHNENDSRRLKDFYFKKLFRGISRQIDVIMADSRNDEKLFSQISKNVVLMPLGADLEKYSKIKRKPQNRVMVFIGRMSPNKRIDRLIEAVSELKKRRKLYRLYVVGPDWTGEQKKLEELARTKNVEKNVTFLGEVSEKKKLDILAKAEFFVSASQYEGFGISAIEAIAAGIPVILNNIQSFTDFVEDGKNGFIVDFNKPEEVAIKIEKIEKQDLARISEEARRVAKKYDWNTLTGKIEDVYRRCLHENR